MALDRIVETLKASDELKRQEVLNKIDELIEEAKSVDKAHDERWMAGWKNGCISGL